MHDDARGLQMHQQKSNMLERLPFGRRHLLLLMALLVTFAVQAQQNGATLPVDTVPWHNAKKATLYSVVLPGLGQAYNRKYWKIPIIYAGFGTLAYFITTNTRNYRDFRTAYNIVYTNDTVAFANNELVMKYDGNLNQLQEGRNFYRRNTELSWIIAGVLYLLQIVDASVDANLYNFDVSDDISLQFTPVQDNYFFSARPAMGLTLRYKF
ncbi:MAG TPA: DUF5683 domain-containing protein [Bacteroidales bacterium]|nr:DUF5683 domain-containing protein [Bacteroidales bacterium]